MSSLTVDTQVVAILGQLREVTELRDAQGKIIGVFTPSGLEERVASLFDLEEAERIVAAEGHLGKPLKDVWRDIHGRQQTSTQ